MNLEHTVKVVSFIFYYIESSLTVDRLSFVPNNCQTKLKSLLKLLSWTASVRDPSPSMMISAFINYSTSHTYSLLGFDSPAHIPKFSPIQCTLHQGRLQIEYSIVPYNKLVFCRKLKMSPVTSGYILNSSIFSF